MCFRGGSTITGADSLSGHSTAGCSRDLRSSASHLNQSNLDAKPTHFSKCRQLSALGCAEHLRGQRLGRELVHKAEGWAREKGCTEMASDTWLDNEVSIAAHLKLGYEESDRLVHFMKRL